MVSQRRAGSPLILLPAALMPVTKNDVFLFDFARTRLKFCRYSYLR